MPWPELTARTTVPDGVWFGTTRGAFFERDGTHSRYATPSAPGIEPPRFRYYAGKRWLRDDHVLDLAVDHDGHVWVLTQTGLNKIEFRQTTLAAKADWFHRKIRSRNIRYGFTAERRAAGARRHHLQRDDRHRQRRGLDELLHWFARRTLRRHARGGHPPAGLGVVRRIGAPAEHPHQHRFPRAHVRAQGLQVLRSRPLARRARSRLGVEGPHQQR